MAGDYDKSMKSCDPSSSVDIAYQQQVTRACIAGCFIDPECTGAAGLLQMNLKL
jgi:hypothetical protein